MSLSTHVLDTARGCPAAAIPVALARAQGPAWIEIAAARTDSDGRIPSLMPPDHALDPAVYRLRFDTAAYFAALSVVTLYPYVDIVFSLADHARHYHIPLLLAPHGYTTYRGS